MHQSIIQQRSSVFFPEHTGVRVYMREFHKAKGLPKDLAKWQATVDCMLDGVDSDGPIYIMIDEGIVTPSKPHRRQGLHIDGYWNPGIQAHGGGGRHSMAAGWDTRPTWVRAKEGWPDEALILASNVQACRGYLGWWEGDPGDGGDCSHVKTHAMKEVKMLPNVAYACNVTALHESITTAAPHKRTLVRLSVPGWSPTDDAPVKLEK